MKVFVLFIAVMIAVHRPAFGLTQASLLASPAEFLQTENTLWQRALAFPITANFDHASLRRVIGTLEKECRTAGFGSGLRYSPEHKGLPKITRRFVRVPLREVLYQISRDTGFAVDIITLEHSPRAILIRNY